jgi:hypothetical protein
LKQKIYFDKKLRAASSYYYDLLCASGPIHWEHFQYFLGCMIAAPHPLLRLASSAAPTKTNHRRSAQQHHTWSAFITKSASHTSQPLPEKLLDSRNRRHYCK